MKYFLCKVQIVLILCALFLTQMGCDRNSCGQCAVAREIPKKVLEVYYFHRTVRCAACNSIEALAHQAVQTYFPVELEENILRWRPTNVDEEANAHFERDFDLKTQSLVLVYTENGKQVRWKNLDRIWDLLDDEPAFLRYVEMEVREMLDD